MAGEGLMVRAVRAFNSRLDSWPEGRAGPYRSCCSKSVWADRSFGRWSLHREERDSLGGAEALPWRIVCLCRPVNLGLHGKKSVGFQRVCVGVEQRQRLVCVELRIRCQRCVAKSQRSENEQDRAQGEGRSTDEIQGQGQVRAETANFPLPPF